MVVEANLVKQTERSSHGQSAKNTEINRYKDYASPMHS